MLECHWYAPAVDARGGQRSEYGRNQKWSEVFVFKDGKRVQETSFESTESLNHGVIEAELGRKESEEGLLNDFPPGLTVDRA